MGSLLTTSVVPQPERLGFWREIVQSTYVSLDVKSRLTDGFFGEIALEPLGCLDLSILRSCGQHAARTTAAVARSNADYFFILGQMKGLGTVRQDANEARLSAGGWAVVDTTRPYDLMFDSPFEQLVLSIPRSALPNVPQASKLITGRDLSRNGPLGTMFAKYLSLLSSQTGALSMEARPMLADSVLNLLAATVSDILHDQSAAGCPPSVQLTRIKAFILERLRDSELCVSTIAGAFRISNRYVHKLFETEGVTVSEYIRRLRLENCRRDLLSERNRFKSITQIAFDWGFNSTAHFSCLFRQRYDVSASEYRQIHTSKRKTDGRQQSGIGVRQEDSE